MARSRFGARGANASDGSIPVGSGILLSLSGASGADRAAVVDVLPRVPGFDPSQWSLQLQGVPLRLAATHGWLEVVDRLLADPRIDPTADNNAALMWAIDKGHTPIALRLLADPRIDPAAPQFPVFRQAAAVGNIEC